jgi:dihydrofolate reductase
MTKPPIDYVQDLKQQPGGDIGIHASTELARSLIGARLVDHLRLVVASNIAGHGKRLFDHEATDELQRFELAEVEQTGRGTLFIQYQAPRRDEALTRSQS